MPTTKLGHYQTREEIYSDQKKLQQFTSACDEIKEIYQLVKLNQKQKEKERADEKKRLRSQQQYELKHKVEKIVDDVETYWMGHVTKDSTRDPVNDNVSVEFTLEQSEGSQPVNEKFTLTLFADNKIYLQKCDGTPVLQSSEESSATSLTSEVDSRKYDINLIHKPVKAAEAAKTLARLKPNVFIEKFKQFLPLDSSMPLPTEFDLFSEYITRVSLEDAKATLALLPYAKNKKTLLQYLPDNVKLHLLKFECPVSSELSCLFEFVSKKQAEAILRQYTPEQIIEVFNGFVPEQAANVLLGMNQMNIFALCEFLNEGKAINKCLLKLQKANDKVSVEFTLADDVVGSQQVREKLSLKLCADQKLYLKRGTEETPSHYSRLNIGARRQVTRKEQLISETKPEASLDTEVKSSPIYELNNIRRRKPATVNYAQHRLTGGVYSEVILPSAKKTAKKAPQYQYCVSTSKPISEAASIQSEEKAFLTYDIPRPSNPASAATSVQSLEALETPKHEAGNTQQIKTLEIQEEVDEVSRKLYDLTAVHKEIKATDVVDILLKVKPETAIDIIMQFLQNGSSKPSAAALTMAQGYIAKTRVYDAKLAIKHLAQLPNKELLLRLCSS